MIFVNEVDDFQVNSTSSRVLCSGKNAGSLRSIIGGTARDIFTVLVSFLVPSKLVVFTNDHTIWLILR